MKLLILKRCPLKICKKNGDDPNKSIKGDGKNRRALCLAFGLKQGGPQMNINRKISHPSAFISSTFADLKKERRAVADVLRRASIYPNTLDIKPASNNSSSKEIINGINDSDFIIVIVGERYGTLNQRITKKPEYSITKWEYMMARWRAKGALVFFKKIRSPSPEQMDDDDSEFHKKRELLKKFKKELADTHNPKPFETIDELVEEVEKALVPAYRDGISMLLTRRDELEKEVEELRKQIDLLSAPVRESQPPTPTNALLGDGLRERAINALIGRPKTKDPEIDASNALRGIYKKKP